jgi:hypothetical protein
VDKFVRYFVIAASGIQAVLAVAFFLQLPVVTAAWPFEGTTPLSHVFIASIFAAAVASQMWVVLTGHWGAFAGIALDYFAILGPLGLLALSRGDGVGTSMTNFGILALAGALLGALLLVWSLRIPLDESIPTPRPLRWSFVLFVLLLAGVSTMLFMQVPNVIPWNITAELGLVIGFMFVGASVYFAYGAARPFWSNAGGQLAGFLAYDVILIVPFVRRLPTVAPEHQTNLLLYLAVILYSGALASYYLFFHKRTGLWR